jgi:hypothetical protein
MTADWRGCAFLFDNGVGSTNNGADEYLDNGAMLVWPG